MNRIQNSLLTVNCWLSFGDRFRVWRDWGIELVLTATAMSFQKS
ncbi:hypothetical protein [Bartonella jaculi]